MSTRTRSGQAGFSLVELLVAMVVTLVVSGAIYGLLAKGQSSFRREPELADRQQNIRVAMDLMQRDISTAGIGVPAFVQVFSRNLDACTDTTRCPLDGLQYAPGLTSGQPDEIEIIANPGNYEGEATCHYGGGSASHVTMVTGTTNVPVNTVILVFMADGTWSLVNADALSGSSSGAGQCPAGTPHADIKFNTGGDITGLNQPSGLCAPGTTGTASSSASCVPIQVGRGEVVRYRIRQDAQGVPNLYRRASGSWGSAANPNWQLVARGIEDLQIEYRHLDPVTGVAMTTWDANPPAAACDPANPTAACCDPGCILPTCQQPAGCIPPTNAGYATLVTEARVTLSSRSEALNVEGAAQSTTSGNKIRGSLTATTTPRMALFALSQRPVAAGGPLWK